MDISCIKKMIVFALEDFAIAMGEFDIRVRGWWKMQPKEFVICDQFVWPSKLFGNFQDWLYISDGREKYFLFYSDERDKFADKVVDIYKNDLRGISRVLRHIYAASTWCYEQMGGENLDSIEE